MKENKNHFESVNQSAESAKSAKAKSLLAGLVKVHNGLSDLTDDDDELDGLMVDMVSRFAGLYRQFGCLIGHFEVRDIIG